MDAGELLTHWTARLAMLLYFLALAVRGSASQSRNWLDVSRLVWTAGCGVYLLHVFCAFQFVHHWSHDAAYAEVARQTAKVTSTDWGGGLYINYVFTLVWVGDVIWWWLDRKQYESRSWVIEWTVQGFLGFIAFNATVVFAEGLTRWFGLAACCALIIIWVRHGIRYFRRSDS